jgi:hypothetical protein
MTSRPFRHPALGEASHSLTLFSPFCRIKMYDLTKDRSTKSLHDHHQRK